MLSAVFASRRLLFAGVAASGAALLGYGYYLQFVEYVEPCPMCIIQRLSYVGIAAVAFIAALHGAGARGRRGYYGSIAALAAGGAAVAARQVWLQHLPPERVPECGPGLEFMLEVYPLHEALVKAFRGTGDCAKVDWTFLGFSIAEWSLACFLGYLVIAILALRRTRA
jgi:disulfide bond formation protein DsbB